MEHLLFNESKNTFIFCSVSISKLELASSTSKIHASFDNILRTALTILIICFCSTEILLPEFNIYDNILLLLFHLNQLNIHWKYNYYNNMSNSTLSITLLFVRLHISLKGQYYIL